MYPTSFIPWMQRRWMHLESEPTACSQESCTLARSYVWTASTKRYQLQQNAQLENRRKKKTPNQSRDPAAEGFKDQLHIEMDHLGVAYRGGWRAIGWFSLLVGHSDLRLTSYQTWAYNRWSTHPVMISYLTYDWPQQIVQINHSRLFWWSMIRLSNKLRLL